MYTEHQIHSAAERIITLRHYHGSRERGETPKKTLILGPALGVPQRFYQTFCGWLVSAGYQVVSFDYYGIGDSRHGSLRRQDTGVLQWGELDAQAVIDWTERHCQSSKLVWFAHSVSGQLFGFIPRTDAIAEVITIATGSGYWRENTPALKPKAWVLWNILVPVLVPLFGYFPGQRVGIVGDIPKTAMWQWRRWCLHQDYILGVEDDHIRARFAAVKQPLQSVHIADDEMLTERNVAQVHDFYVNAKQQRMIYHAQQFGLERLGHFDIFRQSKTGKVWSQLYLPLLEQHPL
ncbi:alpha/beta hydrolase [Pseudidiomarina taiwanensis]|uniref:Alpha/beta hydrolase n=1 Tax=Pseudidiomarina taiwanensis TaxID=337250 RepID=A0A432ZNY0_9GAMM|nr:alpha/beta hydrolase [Pseudidiomarina taiwanensis]RUO79546.1 alpha/beta hydrolase [Pseudidiomarina taiwanensis]